MANSTSPSSEPCPTPGTHPLVQSHSDQDWLYALKFCKAGSKNDPTLDPAQWDAMAEIMDSISEQYGFEFPQYQTSSPLFGFGAYLPYSTPWTWDELAGIGRGAWLLARAIQNAYNNPTNFSPLPMTISGSTLVRNAFRGTKVRVGSSDSLITLLAIELGNAGGVVPPVGLGGSGDTVYMKPGLWRPDRVFVHELGHILDFRLGTTWEYESISNPDSPSAMLLSETGGSYDFSDVIVPNFSTGVVINSQPYIEGGTPTTYGQQNHFEDFADSFFVWVMENSSSFHTDDTDLYTNAAGVAVTLADLYGERVDSTRRNFFDNNIFTFLQRASQ